VTVIAPGGRTGERRAESVQAFAAGVDGTKISFDYQHSGHFDRLASIRREAERDAAEILALANEHSATRAIGISRGARAVIGVLAEDPARFERLVLVLPPGGRAAGRYSSWLASRGGAGVPRLAADVLVIGVRGDRGHPLRVAEERAERLDAQLGILARDHISLASEPLRALIGHFLNR
jgi:pimeloyl-ACP methyl ester carboxylesterase